MEINFILDKSIDLISYLKTNHFSGSMILELLKHQKIKVNNKIVNQTQLLLDNDLLNIQLIDECTNIVASDRPIDIIYEDEYLLIVNKPHNLDSMSSRAHYLDNLSSRIINYYNRNKIKSTIHLVNRLDYLTSGLMIIAKHGVIHEMFKNIFIIKKYILKVEGNVDNSLSMINIKIKKSDEGIKRVVSDDGKEAITLFKTLKKDDKFSYIEATLVTGRTHQLRVSFAHLNHPIVGDILYGSKYQQNLCLTSSYLEFEHPITKKRMKFELHPNF